MIRMAIAGFLAASLALAATAEAQTVDFSWDACTPILTDRAAPNPGGPVTAFVTLTGQTEAYRGFQATWVVGDPNDELPDAWRFEVGGCNDGFFVGRPLPPAELAASCPPFVPGSVAQVIVSDFRFVPDGLGYPKSMGRGVLAIVTQEDLLIPNPNLRYHLARFTFDFSHSAFGPGVPGVSCGGLETPMTLTLVPHRMSYLDAASIEHFWAIGNGVITLNGAAVPARPSTWGSIKGQYRR